jgi:hypothetical protein
MMPDTDSDALYDCALDEARAEARHLEARLHAVTAERNAMRERLANLREGALLVRDALAHGDKFSGGLLAQGLVAQLLGEPRGVGTGPSAADDLGLSDAEFRALTAGAGR